MSKGLFRQYSTDNLQARNKKNKIMKGILFACTAFGIVMLLILLYSILKDGLKHLSFNFLTNFPSRKPEKAGIYSALIGSLYVILLTAVIAFPIGIGAAIYIEEYMKKNKFRDFLELNISNLAGVPSIVYGLLGLAVFVQGLMLGRGILTASLTLAILILPMIIITSQEAIRNVPTALREGSYALGVTKWQSITGVVLPFALPAILTGTILSISRALGESAPLIMVGAASYVSFVPRGLTTPYTTLPLQIYNWTSRPQAAFQELAAAAIIVLLVITLALNAIGIILRNKYENKVEY